MYSLALVGNFCCFESWVNRFKLSEQLPRISKSVLIFCDQRQDIGLFINRYTFIRSHKTMSWCVDSVLKMDDKRVQSAKSNASSFCLICNFKIRHDDTFYDSSKGR